MNSTRATVLIAVLAVALGSLFVVPTATSAEAAGRPAGHFDLMNATLDSVIALAIAATNGDAFEDIALDRPLQGGRTSITFDVPAGGCLRDLRVTFHGGRTQLFPRVDVCHGSGLRLTRHGGSPQRSGA